ncbi:hypothetical protein BEI02_16960 [Elizabethkingia sp. HvH-WGS333]|uniref:acyl carrier protein n=1 Tax=Elizabethkingia TaxID=308865 RepID=UPI00074164FF|nr:MULTISPECIES: acyl carrier protein [Elizabethkingia]KUG10409.1 hypothetical protein AMC91_17000 [Elizabethkingia miricola]MCL1655374.1 acyl carrier protein [Elizabethkingia miricola]MCP1252904.1 acyl carrier protein [Elizabethkingia sp. S0634]MDX8573101.1 acyl carrier protein [Elizabethkingia sp. HX QKY]OIK45775.1 hypothetical protein BEI02_16960 [Elizabethkingia sp. HvH-WGS333]
MEIQKFIQKFKEQLEDEATPIFPETNYVHSEFWDSLTAMVIKVMIDDEYQIDIPVEKLNTFLTIQDLFDYIKSIK